MSAAPRPVQPAGELDARDAYIDAIVAAAPPLSAEVHARLGALLRPVAPDVHATHRSNPTAQAA